MDSQTLLIVIIAILCFDFILDQVLDILNLRNQKPQLPSELQGIYDNDKYQKSLEYYKANARFSFITSTFSFLLITGVIVTGTFGWLDAILKERISNPIFVSLAFFGVLFIASDILNIPFSLYKTFVIEEKFGFNKMSLKTFIFDKIKGYFLTITVGGLILGTLLFLINTIGPNFWIGFWIVISIFIVFVNMFYTSHYM